MTLEQARFRYRISLIGMPILVLSILLTRYGTTWNVYARLVGVTGIAAIGVAIVWWGMRYGDMIDAHDAAVAAAQRWPLKGADARAAKAQTCAENWRESPEAHHRLGGCAKCSGDDAA
jgi:hypothetical protein